MTFEKTNRIVSTICKISVPDQHNSHHPIKQYNTKYIRLPTLHHFLAAKIHKTRQTKKSIFYHRLLFLSLKQSGHLLGSSQCSIKKKFQIYVRFFLLFIRKDQVMAKRAVCASSRSSLSTKKSFSQILLVDSSSSTRLSSIIST